MGLLDQLGSLLGKDQGNFTQILQWAEQQGGLTGLLEKFRQGGLENIVQSWIGNGTNLPISAEQIQQVLGTDAIQNLASKIGVNPTEASETLSKYLPDIVHQLTPDGNESTLSEAKNLLASGLDFLKNKIG
ncbi:YidB family protein [Neisseria sp. Ec49-e6-T10]|uniref:YidB family protein n=1 Tax=Neisseria sp. Ec49-e6-T10 TaxID=3140744 RepID=UPI003EC03E04